MKTVLNKLTSEKARKELKLFSLVGCICVCISLFAFSWLAMAGIAAAGRGLLLTLHDGNESDSKLLLYKVTNVIVLVIGAIEVITLFVAR